MEENQLNNNQGEAKEIQGQEGQQGEEGEVKQGKSKEENFDGLQKKFNATKKENSVLKSELATLKDEIAQIKAKGDNASKAEDDRLARLENELKQFISGQQEKSFNDTISSSLEDANFDSKFVKNKIAITLLKDIAQDEGLDLTSKSDRIEAIEKLKSDYPELLSKKSKQIGIGAGQGAGKNHPNLSALDDMDKFLSLPKEKREEIKKQAFSE